MVDIQSPIAEIRQGKKEEEKRRRRSKPQGKNIISASATQGRHKNTYFAPNKPISLGQLLPWVILAATREITDFH